MNNWEIQVQINHVKFRVKETLLDSIAIVRLKAHSTYFSFNIMIKRYTVGALYVV